MLSAGVWKRSQANTILFVLINTSGIEVTGASPNVYISKAGAAFAAGAGTTTEIGLGWYSYTSTSGEADTPGPVAVVVDGSGFLQQNLEYVVEDRVVAGIEFTYTVTDSTNNNPLSGVNVVIGTHASGSTPIWSGTTDVFGVARDINSNKPRLQAGTYYFFRTKPGYVFSDPDSETVS